MSLTELSDWPPFTVSVHRARVRAACCGVFATLLAWAGPVRGAIDRHALVTRHNPVVRTTDFAAPLSVGNGGFAFTVDFTGLQTFGEQAYRRGFPLETLARWAWTSEPNPNDYKLSETFKSYREADGREQSYPTNTSTPAATWLRRNPHDHPLAQVSLDWHKPDGTAFVPADVVAPEQTLDLWSGVITSRYTLGGKPVVVRTACAPDSDTVAVEIDSPLVSSGELHVRVSFPSGHDLSIKNTPPLDWSHPESHRSQLDDPHTVRRQVNELTYTVRSNLAIAPADAAHLFSLEPINGCLAFSLTFAPELKGSRPSGTQPAPVADEIFSASARHWKKFWDTSAVLDLSGSTDSRAEKLERRVILSQYLTAIQCAGDVPPQESGLTCSTWYGKHHTEMIWWHAAHFALWGHPELLERNLAWYLDQLPTARALARERQLRGARWVKMTGPMARESPGGNPLIVWNQPHAIYLAELSYRVNPSAATLAKYRELVEQTAECLASMVHLDSSRDRYVLGPPLWIAQEIHEQATSQNPAFELAYWGWALRVAQSWRERAGESRDPHWQEVIDRLSPLPQSGGKYVALESHPDTWENIASRHDHPEMLMALGFLPPTSAVERDTMNRTLEAVLATWDWETKIWGWDYPMIAMTAARLGRPADAVDVLLRDGPNNRYLANGHCPQRSDSAVVAGNKAPARAEIAVYLPANGAFLSAVALMVAGWDGSEGLYPGFPHDGSWHIQAEGWRRLP